MKKFILLFMLVFGINTAVNAQTKLVFTDNETKEVLEYNFDKSFTSNQIQLLRDESNRTTSNAAQYPGSFGLHLAVRDGSGYWNIYNFEYFYPAGHTFQDIINNIIRWFF